MTKTEKAMMEATGLSEKDFQPKPRPDQRLDDVEQRTDAMETTMDDMILLMAELIGGE